MAEVYTMANVMKSVLRRGVFIDYVNTRSKRGLKWIKFCHAAQLVN